MSLTLGLKVQEFGGKNLTPKPIGIHYLGHIEIP